MLTGTKFMFIALLFIVPSYALADTWPARPIRWIVPYPAGGSPDVVSRLIANKMTISLGQPVVIENRPGADTIAGTTALAHAEPDGYTIGTVTDTLAIQSASKTSLPYDVTRDLVGVALLVEISFFFIVNTDEVPQQSLHDVVEHAKRNPAWLTFATLGPSSVHQIMYDVFKRTAGFDALPIAYRGSIQALQDLMTGRVKSMIRGGFNLDEVAGTKIRPLASATSIRMPGAEAIPTFREQGYPFDFKAWYGVAAPSKTSPEIVRRLNAEIIHAMSASDVAALLEKAGLSIASGTAEDMTNLLSSDLKKYKQILSSK